MSSQVVNFSAALRDQIPVGTIDTIVAGDAGALQLLITGLEADDDVIQVAFEAKVSTSDLDTAPTTILRTVHPVPDGDTASEGIFTVAGKSYRRLVVVRLTSAETAKLATADYTYSWRMWVLRDGEQLIRATNPAAIAAQVSAVGITSLSFIGTFAADVPAPIASAAGILTQVGTGAVQVPAPTAAHTGAQAFSGAAAAQVPALVVAGNAGIATVPSDLLFAYGLRRVNQLYTGPALRVQRSSDSAQQDIGFNGLGLDEAALTAFVGAGNGDIVTLYDQSGNGYHQTRGAGTLRLVAAGVINRGPNSLPKAVGTAAWLAAAGTVTSNQPVTVFTVAQRTAGTATGFFGAAGANPFNRIWYGYETTDRYGAWEGDGTNASSILQTGSASDAGAVRTYAALFTTTSMVQAINGALSASIARAQRGTSSFSPSIGTQYRLLTGDWYECLGYARTITQSEWDTIHALHASLYSSTMTLWSSLTARPTVILMGEANCAGRAPMAGLPVAYQGPQAGVSIWTGSAFATLDSTANNNQFAETPNSRFAWEMSLGKDYLTRTGASAINLVKYGGGAAPIARNGTNLSWDPTWLTTSGNALFFVALNEVWEAIVAMQAAGLRPDVKALQWFQGETDAGTQAFATAYASNLTALIAAMRTALGMPSLPVHLMRIADEATMTYRDTVRAAAVSVAGAVAGVTLVSVDALSMLDDRNLDAIGQIALGTTLAGLL